MAAKPVRFHPEANEEYLSSLSWYNERSPTAALDFESEFQRVIAAIAEAPERWPRYLSRCRRYVLRQFPFSVVSAFSTKKWLYSRWHTGTAGPAIGEGA